MSNYSWLEGGEPHGMDAAYVRCCTWRGLKEFPGQSLFFPGIKQSKYPLPAHSVRNQPQAES